MLYITKQHYYNSFILVNNRLLNKCQFHHAKILFRHIFYLVEITNLFFVFTPIIIVNRFKIRLNPNKKKFTMPKTQQLKSKTAKNAKDEYFSDSDLIMLIAIIINQNPQFQNIQKGIWLWNRTDECFRCSAGFRELI